MQVVRHRRISRGQLTPDTPRRRSQRVSPAPAGPAPAIPEPASPEPAGLVAAPPAVPPAVGPAASEPPALEEFSGARLLISDIRVAGLLLNHARLRALERYLGVPKEQANLATLVMALVLAESLHERSTRAVQAMRAPKRPSGGDVFLATAVVRALAEGIAGPTASDTPGFGLLIAIAAVATVAKPLAQRARVGVRVQSRRARELFQSRYGHLLARASG